MDHNPLPSSHRELDLPYVNNYSLIGKKKQLEFTMYQTTSKIKAVPHARPAKPDSAGHFPGASAVDFFPALRKPWSDLGCSCTKLLWVNPNVAAFRCSGALFSTMPAATQGIQAWGQALILTLTAHNVLSDIFAV